ncbi:hypothetical protein BX666DRAFT_455824 [Dichotomocladium elegans]|nr:hypothetical protein BX666DRAFT_455824 [Dichotomocladium elegans]
MSARAYCCDPPAIRPKRLVAVLTGIQVIRAFWEVWGCVDNEWSSMIMPIVYTSCVLSMCMMVVSMWATWGIYKNHAQSLNFSWWIYYVLTVLTFIDNSALLSIMCVSKDRYITGCRNDIRANTVGAVSTCALKWDESVIWASIVSITTLIINITFIYMLYQVKSQHPHCGPTSVHPDGRGMEKPTDADGFQDIELK